MLKTRSRQRPTFLTEIQSWQVCWSRVWVEIHTHWWLLVSRLVTHTPTRISQHSTTPQKHLTFKTCRVRMWTPSWSWSLTWERKSAPYSKSLKVQITISRCSVKSLKAMEDNSSSSNSSLLWDLLRIQQQLLKVNHVPRSQLKAQPKNHNNNLSKPNKNPNLNSSSKCNKIIKMMCFTDWMRRPYLQEW